MTLEDRFTRETLTTLKEHLRVRPIHMRGMGTQRSPLSRQSTDSFRQEQDRRSNIEAAALSSWCELLGLVFPSEDYP